MAKAKKSAVKKGKYISHTSPASSHLRTKPDGPTRLDASLPHYDFGMMG